MTFVEPKVPSLAKILVLTSIFGMKFQTFKYFSHFFTFSLNFWPKKGWSQIFTFLLFFQLCHSSALVGGGQSIAMNWIKLANNVKQINLGCYKITYVTARKLALRPATFTFAHFCRTEASCEGVCESSYMSDPGGGG